MKFGDIFTDAKITFGDIWLAVTGQWRFAHELESLIEHAAPQQKVPGTGLSERSGAAACAATEIGPEQYRCEMCGGIFDFAWSDEDARAEAIANGFADMECGLICDDCYQKTPWGK